ncbi:MAG: ABC transporter ATP-binding protein [Rhodospirillaceae bacterium]|nr:ABC transporter ATP-binding protein [Rhodospirillaceae bacterium]
MSRLAAEAVRVALGARLAVDDVSTATAGGEVVGLIGPNGAGKTTLLRAMAGLIEPQSGRVTLGGRPLAGLGRIDRARRIGYLPQAGEIHWALPVAEVVLMGRLPHLDPWQSAGDEDRAIAARAMAALGIGDLAGRAATRLSGGEKARVLLARALAGEPEILLADEPVAGLDPYFGLEVMEHLAARAAAGMGVVVVLHDLALAARFCHRLVLMQHGKVAAEGAPADVLSPERLAAVYRIEALRGRHEGADYVLPWRRVDRPPEN